MRDPYSILGVSRTATTEELKRAFRMRAKTVHPDHRPPEEQERAHEEMNELLAAWEKLSKQSEQQSSVKMSPAPNRNSESPKTVDMGNKPRRRSSGDAPPQARRLPTTNWLLLSGRHTEPLHIPAGETVVLDGSHHGPVLIEATGTLIVQGVQEGPVDAVGATVRVRGTGCIIGTLTVASSQDITLRGPVSRLVVTTQ